MAESIAGVKLKNILNFLNIIIYLRVIHLN